MAITIAQAKLATATMFPPSGMSVTNEIAGSRPIGSQDVDDWDRGVGGFWLASCPTGNNRKAAFWFFWLSGSQPYTLRVTTFRFGAFVNLPKFTIVRNLLEFKYNICVCWELLMQVEDSRRMTQCRWFEIVFCQLFRKSIMLRNAFDSAFIEARSSVRNSSSFINWSK